MEMIKEQNGGMIYVPPGNYETSAINFCSNVTFHIEAGAYIKFLSDEENHPVVMSRWEGIDQLCYMPYLYSGNEKNINVTGGVKIDEW